MRQSRRPGTVLYFRVAVTGIARVTMDQSAARAVSLETEGLFRRRFSCPGYRDPVFSKPNATWMSGSDGPSRPQGRLFPPDGSITPARFGSRDGRRRRKQRSWPTAISAAVIPDYCVQDFVRAAWRRLHVPERGRGGGPFIRPLARTVWLRVASVPWRGLPDRITPSVTTLFVARVCAQTY